MKCLNCGQKVPGNARFCPVCGKSVEQSAAAPVKGEGKRFGGMALYHWILSGAYGIALLVCFICNLAVEHTLSWFFIVLCGVLIGFSVTNLPFLLKKGKLYLPAAAVTVLIFLLLFACQKVTGGNWFRDAFLLAALPLLGAWLILLVIGLKKANWFFRSALLSLIAGVFVLIVNPWVAAVLAGDLPGYMSYFETQFGPQGHSSIANGILAVCMFLYFLVGTVLGTVSALRQARRDR